MFASTLDQIAVEQEPELRLWRAVIARTVQEWLSGPLRTSREAEAFLFADEVDFPTVCHAAGLHPQTLRSKLLRFKKQGGDSAGHFPVQN